MPSKPEHTNRPRPPQQAHGHKWPILVLLLGVATLTLALTACGGSSSSSAPGATTGSPSTATSPPASTPTPNPTEAAETGASAEPAQEALEYYVRAYCFFLGLAAPQPATWGEWADQIQMYLDGIEKDEPPEVLRDFFEAVTAQLRLRMRFAEDRRSLSYEDKAGWDKYREGPEMAEAARNTYSAYQAIDDDMLSLLNSEGFCWPPSP